MSDNLGMYKLLWQALSKLCSEGQDDSEEAALLRDQMDGPWYRLTPEEMKQLEEWFQCQQ